jgi:DNA-directed RNA polymerase specialized sigma24 family protein
MAEVRDDYELMEGIARGDSDALAAIYDRYGALVFTLGFRMLRDRGEAEELTSDVFLEIWKKSDRYDPNRGAPMTYLVTLARSRAIDRKRAATARTRKTISRNGGRSGVGGHGSTGVGRAGGELPAGSAGPGGIGRGLSPGGRNGVFLMV